MVTDQHGARKGEIDVGPGRFARSTRQSLESANVVVSHETNRAANEVRKITRDVRSILRQEFAQLVQGLAVARSRLVVLDNGSTVSRRQAPAPIETDERVTPRGFAERRALEKKDGPLAEFLVEGHGCFAVELQGHVQWHHVEPLVGEVEERREFEWLHDERLVNSRRRLAPDV